MKTKRITALLLMIALLIPAMVFSQGRQMRNFRKAGNGKFQAEKKLNLTEEQKEKMKELRLSNQKVMIDLRANLQKAKIDLRQLMDTDNPDVKAIGTKADQISGIQGKIMKNQVLHKVEISKIFTKEQKALLKEMRGKRRAGVRGMHMRQGRGMNQFNRGRQGRGMHNRQMFRGRGFGRGSGQGFGGQGFGQGFGGQGFGQGFGGQGFGQGFGGQGFGQGFGR